MDCKIPISKPIIEQEDVDAVSNAIKAKHLSAGEYVAKLEKEFAAYVGTKEAVALNSGTAALHACLVALGIGAGDEVITTPFTFAASANVIVLAGAKVVFADVQADTLNIDPEDVKRKVTKRTKAILPVHYAGQCADMDELMDLAQAHSLFVVEDACEAHGALFKNRMAGSIGDAGAFSFYPNKNMATGEGGVLTTNNEDLAMKVRILGNHGQDCRYHHVEIGWNYKMPDYVAALARVQLKRLDFSVKERNVIAQYYDSKLKCLSEIQTPHTRSCNSHTYMLYPIFAQNSKLRDGLKYALDKAGVETRISFPSVHLQPVYKREFGFKEGQFPVSEHASETVLCLPIFAGLTQKEQDYIIDVIKTFVGKKNHEEK